MAAVPRPRCWWDCASPCPYSCCCASALSSPRTPAVARATSSSSYGAWPARAMTTPSIAPSQALATTFAGGPGGIEPSLRPVSISCAQCSNRSRERPVDHAADRIVPAAELDPQRHHRAGDVSPTVHGVSARHHEQAHRRVGLVLGQRTHLRPPGFVDPLQHRERQVFLALELVIEGAARIAGVARHLLQYEVGVAVTGQTARGGLEQGAARACAALGLGRARALCRSRRHWAS